MTMLMQSRRPHWSRRVARTVLGAFRWLGKPQPAGWRYGYERCGIQVWGEPIPWNAETVLVELPAEGIRSRAAARGDYRLELAGGPSVRPAAVSPEQGTARRVSFRLPPPGQDTSLTVRFRDRVLGRGLLPFLSEAAFLERLRLESALLLAQIGRHLVPCQAVVPSQCRSLQACGVLTSATSLLPLAGVPFSLEFTRGSEGRSFSFPVRLAPSHLTAGRAFVALPPVRCPAGLGAWSVRWSAAGWPLAHLSLRTLSRRAFRRSLYLVDAGFRTEGRCGSLYKPFLTVLDGLTRVGPCFRVASREEGAAGLCRLEVCTRVRSPAAPPAPSRLRLLVAGTPTAVLPPALTPEVFLGVEAFELRCRGRGLGTLEAGVRRPAAQFTSEGGFHGTEEFAWSAAAEQELAQRLEKLLALGAEGPLPNSP